MMNIYQQQRISQTLPSYQTLQKDSAKYTRHEKEGNGTFLRLLRRNMPTIQSIRRCSVKNSKSDIRLTIRPFARPLGWKMYQEWDFALCWNSLMDALWEICCSRRISHWKSVKRY